VKKLKEELKKLIYWYNYERPHQSLKYLTPIEKMHCGFVDNSASYPQAPQAQHKLFDI